MGEKVHPEILKDYEDLLNRVQDKICERVKSMPPCELNSFSKEQLYDQLVEYFYIKYPMIDNETHKKSVSMISDVISDTIRNHVINSARTTRSGSISSKVAEFLLTPINSLVGSNSNSFFDVCEDDTDLECVSSSKRKDVRRYKHNAVAESSSPVLSNGLPASPAHVDTVVVQPTLQQEKVNMKF